MSLLSFLFQWCAMGHPHPPPPQVRYVLGTIVFGDWSLDTFLLYKSSRASALNSPESSPFVELLNRPGHTSLEGLMNTRPPHPPYTRLLP